MLDEKKKRNIPARRHLETYDHEGVLRLLIVYVDVEVKMVVDRIPNNTAVFLLDNNSADGITMIVFYFAFLVRHAHHAWKIVDENLSSVLVVNEVDKHVHFLFIVILFSNDDA